MSTRLDKEKNPSGQDREKLPKQSPKNDEKLSDEELKDVSGGRRPGLEEYWKHHR